MRVRSDESIRLRDMLNKMWARLYVVDQIEAMHFAHTTYKGVGEIMGR